jgi:hypothetical protein
VIRQSVQFSPIIQYVGAIETMKKVILSLCLLSSLIAMADEVDQVIDKRLFRSLRARYDGTWKSTKEGTLAAEILKDGSILVEASDRFAEFAFYNIPRAKEDFQYIPSTVTSGWLNYFDRTGPSIKCGGSSYDLKKDPFPSFKCRMTVDAQGNVTSFMDRSATTSNAKPGGYDGWEDGSRDFHWRAVTELTDPADAYSEHNVRRGSGFQESFHLQIFGETALALYRRLDAKTENIWWGPNHPVEIKYGRQIWCLSPDKGKTAKCRIVFGFDGNAKPPSRD